MIASLAWIHNAPRAISAHLRIRAFRSGRHFVRTPKQGSAEGLGYAVRTHGTWMVELGLSAYLAVGVMQVSACT